MGARQDPQPAPGGGTKPAKFALLELPGQGAGQQLAAGAEGGRWFAHRGTPHGQELRPPGGAEFGELGNRGLSHVRFSSWHDTGSILSPSPVPKFLRFELRSEAYAALDDSASLQPRLRGAAACANNAQLALCKAMP